jgi:type IV secretion system protein VirD4
MTELAFPEPGVISAALRMPESLVDPGILVGWSLEHRHPTRPIGFTYGDPNEVPSTGFVDPIQLAREGHLITIAPTGAGKGRGCIIPALLQHQGPVIVIDPKGENAAITTRYRREMGQQVIVLDPMRITDQPPDAFNPLDMIDIESAVAVDDVAAIAHALWGDQMSARDRFWTGRAEQVTIGLLLHLLADRPASMRNFNGLRRLVANAVSNPESMLAAMTSSSHPEAQIIASALKLPAPETLGGILAFCQELVDFLRGPLVQDATAKSTFDVEGIMRGDPYSIYVVLPPHMLESHGRLLRIWISSMLGGITRRYSKPPKPTLFILDETAQLGPLPQLRQAITLLRGYGLQTWSFWQDVSQLKMLYPSDWQTMINNCRVLQCFGALNMNAADGMAQLTGLHSGDQVLSLKPDEMILQLAGDSAVVARLPDYLADPPFAKRFDPNPFYQNDRPVARKPPRIQLREQPTRIALRAAALARSKPRDPSEPDPLLDRLLALWETK